MKTSSAMICVTHLVFLICIFIDGTKAYWHVSSSIEAEDEITDLKLKFNTGNETILKFTALGTKYDLTLIPLNDIFVPNFQVFTTKSLPNDETKFDVLEDSSVPLKGSFYQVNPTQGAVYLDKSGDSYHLEGIIDDDKRLVNDKPNSYKLIKLGWKYAKRSHFEGHNASPSFFHQISKRKLQDVSNSLVKNKVTIETLVILDESNIKRLEVSKVGIKKYLGIFWNSVNRRYADIDNPKINFVLVGALKADSHLISSSTFKQGHLNGSKLLDDLSYWLYRNKKLIPKYDVAMLETSLDLVLHSDGQFDSSLLGRAYVSGICYSDADMKRAFDVGISEDIAPVYSGVLTTAHEVGHILGAPHDGSREASNCPGGAGYLMDEITLHGPKSWHFSTCSKKIIRHQLQHNADCVYDLPKHTIPLLDNLPGEVIQLDSLCEAMYGANYKVYKKDSNLSDVCNKVRCYRPGSTQTYTFREIPEGTTCGKNKVCLKGICSVKNT